MLYCLAAAKIIRISRTHAPARVFFFKNASLQLYELTKLRLTKLTQKCAILTDCALQQVMKISKTADYHGVSTFFKYTSCVLYPPFEMWIAKRRSNT